MSKRDEIIIHCLEALGLIECIGFIDKSIPYKIRALVESLRKELEV